MSCTVLSLQPYYGGSHQAFMNCWQRHSRLSWLTLDLPARHWKWRMRHAAWDMAQRANRLWDEGKRWSINFCTDMLNLAEFKGLVRTEIANLPSVIYFHENQLEYPTRFAGERDLHFGITNFSAALAADAVWFNSKFNRNTLFEHLEKLCGKWPDFPPRQQGSELQQQCQVVPPCLDLPHTSRTNRETQPLHLLWAARWEHDKGPDELHDLLNDVAAMGLEFELSIMGQSFRHVPDAFDKIQAIHQHRIKQWGYQPSREAYWKTTLSANVFVSTAQHEFFGLAACESIAAGLYPVLPNRLAYPELLDSVPDKFRHWFLYENHQHAVEILRQIPERWREFVNLNLANHFKTSYGSATHAKRLDEKLCSVIR